MQRWDGKREITKVLPSLEYLECIKFGMHIWHSVLLFVHGSITQAPNLLDKYLRSSACVPPACLQVLAMRSDSEGVQSTSLHCKKYQNTKQHLTAPNST